ncbi:protein regulator of cytokinesis 1-like [Hyalella azteca]|uniref:Protein regulator of cytokinesis 1-like n=1 Tax=Hyalella azteca TaxID=294128 RepID=A0A8B7N677_HYAAZ|nr:protein regulator of cytokinesis 1-like [Hyalella azteca]
MSASFSRVGDEGVNESLLKQLASYMEDMQRLLTKLHQLWKEVGFSTSDQLKRIADLKNRVKEFYAEEKAHKKMLIDEVEEKSKEVFTLSKELGVNADELYTNDSLSLLQMDQHLSHRLQSLRQEVSSRHKDLQKLLKEEEELCSELLEEVSSPCAGTVPSKEEIASVQRRINTLMQEKKHRLHTFRALKEQISGLIVELDQPANSSFPTNIIHSNEGLGTLSLHNLDAMKRLKSDLTAKVSANKRELKQLQQKVQELWDRLSVPQLDREHMLLDNISGKTPADLTLYRAELLRLEEMKKANISRNIDALRTEVELWWQRCYVGDDEKLQCEVFYKTETNDEVLMGLEAEVERLKEKHAAAQHIYDKLDLRDSLWNKLIKLELGPNDPSRLFKNRLRAFDTLPRVEAQLKESVSAWELEQKVRLGRPVVFTVRGVPLHDFMHREQYTDSKHLQAKERSQRRVLTDHSPSGRRDVTLRQSRRLRAKGAATGGRICSLTAGKCALIQSPSW